MKQYVDENQLLPTEQSAYRQHHSTETALVKVMNDMLLAIDSRRSVFLVLLDLSAAFDTVDQQRLLDRMEADCGINGSVRGWLQSYFADRNQMVVINGEKSQPQALETGMPQGSHLGPFCFPLYTAPLVRIADAFGCNIHMYADDTQLYMTFDSDDCVSVLNNFECCIAKIREWMNNNFFKLNDSKTEFLILKQRNTLLNNSCEHVKIGNSDISSVKSVKNLGCIFDENLCMENHVQNVCSSCYFTLYQISRIRQNLSEKTTTLLVNSLLLSKLDYANGLLIGLGYRIFFYINYKKFKTVQHDW